MRIGFYIPGYEHLGIDCLSAVLKQAGHETLGFFAPLLCKEGFFHTATLEKWFDMDACIVDRIVESDLDLLAFSCVTDNFVTCCRIARAVKQRKNIPIVFGGIHCSSVPERVIQQPEIDYVVVGEGEGALLDLVTQMAADKRRLDIPNVWCQDGDRIVSNPPRPLIEDLDALPFPDKEVFYDVAPAYLRRHYTTTATRGCVFACTYCNNSRMRALYKGKGCWRRRRSADNFIQELREADAKYAFADVRFWDELFIDDKAWLRAFVPLYRREIGKPFYCYGHVKFLDEETVALLEQAGCQELNLGVECIGEDTRRNLLRRVYSNEDLQHAFELVRSTKIWLSTGNILGLPGQPIEEALEMAAFYNEHRVEHPLVYFFRYYPNTEIVDKAVERGLLAEEQVNAINDPRKGQGGIAWADAGDAPDLVRIRSLIHLTTILPRRWIRWLLTKDRWRSIPLVNISPFVALFSAFLKRVWSRKRPTVDGYTPSLQVWAMILYGFKKMQWKLNRTGSGS